jgi:hypothetical protein
MNFSAAVSRIIIKLWHTMRRAAYETHDIYEMFNESNRNAVVEVSHVWLVGDGHKKPADRRNKKTMSMMKKVEWILFTGNPGCG